MARQGMRKRVPRVCWLESTPRWQYKAKKPGAPAATRMPGVPYVWGMQPVESLGLLVFTDGEDILAVPLSAMAGGL